VTDRRVATGAITIAAQAWALRRRVEAVELSESRKRDVVAVRFWPLERNRQSAFLSDEHCPPNRRLQ